MKTVPNKRDEMDVYRSSSSTTHTSHARGMHYARKSCTPQELNIMQYHEVNRFVRCILSSNCGLWNKRCSLDYLRKANRFPLVSFVDGK